VSRRKAASRSIPSWAEVACAAVGSARTTVPEAGGSASIRAASWARKRRLTWWRVTLFPTPRPTTKPTIGTAAGAAPANWWTTTVPLRARAPERTTEAKSLDRRMRLAGRSTDD